MIAQLALEFADRHTVMPPGWQGWSIPNEFGNLVNIAVPVVGLVLVTRRPANRIGWLFLVAGLALGLTGFGSAYGLHGLVAAPGSLPAARAALWLNNWVWTIPFAALSFLFLLFPTGRLRSRRWLPAAWLVGICFVALLADMLVTATLIWSHPFRSKGPFFGPALLVILTVALVISVAAAITRYAGSAGEERLQLTWFAAAALVLAAAQVASFWNGSVAVSVLSNLAFLGLWAAIAIAVVVWLRVGHELRPAASSGQPAGDGPAALVIGGDALPALPGAG